MTTPEKAIQLIYYLRQGLHVPDEFEGLSEEDVRHYDDILAILPVGFFLDEDNVLGLENLFRFNDKDPGNVTWETTLNDFRVKKFDQLEEGSQVIISPESDFDQTFEHLVTAIVGLTNQGRW